MQAMRLPFRVEGAPGSSAAMSCFVIGGDALQPADRDRLFLEAPPAAGGLAWTVACASQNSREHIRLPIDHIGRRYSPLLRSCGYIRGPGCAPDTPTDSRRPCESSSDRRRPSAPRRFVLPPVPEMPGFRSPCLTSYANLRTKLLKSAWKATKGREVGIGSPFSRQARARTAQNAHIASLKRGQVSASR